MLITIRGTTKILMNNPQTVDRMNEHAKALSKVGRKNKNKTDQDEELNRKLDFIARLYFDETLGPCWPTYNFIQCLRDAARLTKQGKSVERGLSSAQPLAKLEYDGPRDVEGLYTGGFYDLRPVRNNGSGRVVRVRPAFQAPWQITFDLRVLEDFISPDDIINFATTAGRAIGLGDYRQRFGRFEVVT